MESTNRSSVGAAGAGPAAPGAWTMFEIAGSGWPDFPGQARPHNIGQSLSGVQRVPCSLLRRQPRPARDLVAEVVEQFLRAQTPIPRKSLVDFLDLSGR